MARMVVIYKKPENPGAFDQHYSKVHVPMARKLPGLRKYEVSDGPIVKVAGDPETYLIATLYFDSLAAIKEAFATAEGKACAADRRNLVPDDADIQIYLFDHKEL